MSNVDPLSRQVEIIPAILPKSFEELEGVLARLRSVAPLVQVDLVGNNILAGHETYPFWEEFDIECDIMLLHPEQEVRTCIDVGASRIVVHAAAPGAREALQMLQDTREGDFAIKVGLALAAHDTLEVLREFENLYDYVQVMGIDHIGKQGEPPDPHHRELELIKSLRKEYPDLVIQVDGAVAAHPRELVEAGANRLIIGSAIIKAEDPRDKIKSLYTEVNVSS